MRQSQRTCDSTHVENHDYNARRREELGIREKYRSPVTYGDRTEETSLFRFLLVVIDLFPHGNNSGLRACFDISTPPRRSIRLFGRNGGGGGFGRVVYARRTPAGRRRQSRRAENANSSTGSPRRRVRANTGHGVISVSVSDDQKHGTGTRRTVFVQLRPIETAAATPRNNPPPTECANNDFRDADINWARVRRTRARTCGGHVGCTRGRFQLLYYYLFLGWRTRTDAWYGADDDDVSTSKARAPHGRSAVG